MTLNTQLFTGIVLFFSPWNEAFFSICKPLFWSFLPNQLKVNIVNRLTEISIHLRPSIGINHHRFPDSNLSMLLDINGNPASLLTDAFSGGKTLNPVLQKADHAMDHFPAAEYFWSTSAETTSVERLLHGLKMKYAELNYLYRCLG